MAINAAQQARVDALEAKRATTNTQEPVEVSDSIDLGGGVKLNKTDKAYTALQAKGYDDQQIIDTYKKVQEKQANNVPSETIEQEKAKIEPETPIAPVEEITTEKLEEPVVQQPIEDEKGPELLPVSDYLDDSEARQANIIANLNNARNTAPQSLRNESEFKEFYNYEGRSELQKKTLDTRYRGYKNGQTLATKTADDLYSMYNSNSINNTDLDNLNLTDPVKYAETMALIEKKNKLNTYADELYGTEDTSTNQLQTLIDSYVSNLQNYSTSTDVYTEYKEAMKSDNITSQMTAINDKQGEIDQLNLQLTQIQKDVEKEYEGSGATGSKISSIVADEQYEITQKLSAMNIDKSTMIANYNSATGAIQDEFDIKLQQQAYEMQQRTQQMSELGFAMELADYETAEQADERAWNNYVRQQEYTDGNIYSSDPATRQKAISKAVDTVLAEFSGIPMVRSREEMIEDITAMVNNGSDLGDAITENIRKPIMNKAEYKAWSAEKFGISEDALNLAGLNMDWNPETNSWNLISGVDGLEGSDLVKALASGKYNGNKFFGVYATGDAEGTTRGSIYNTIETEGLDSYMNRVAKDAPVTAEMIKKASAETGIDSKIIATFLQADSNFGKSGLGAKNNNPGNVGQFDRLGTEAVEGYATMQDGVTAAAKNLQSRMSKLSAMAGGTATDGTAQYNTSNDSNFSSYLKQFSESGNGQAAFGGTGAEREAALKGMGYKDWADFNTDYNVRLQSQAQDAPDPGFVTALEYVTNNPLFDYTDESGNEKEGLLGSQGFIDAKIVSTIEDNLMKGNKWDEGLGVGLSSTILGKYPKIGDFAESLRTIRNSKVIDIVKTGKVKLYPMSDADIGLLAGSVGLQINSFADKNKAKATMTALNNMLQSYKQNGGTETAPTGNTGQNIYTPANYSTLSTTPTTQYQTQSTYNFNPNNY